jgi:hypothetical protein
VVGGSSVTQSSSRRCLVRRARNVLAKAPKSAQEQVKADYWAIFDRPEDVEPGLDPVAKAQAQPRPVGGGRWPCMECGTLG